MSRLHYLDISDLDGYGWQSMEERGEDLHDLDRGRNSPREKGGATERAISVCVCVCFSLAILLR